mmetsp:Transcript_25585/g.60098  ORF Transcript_25585/g.60098 Transcript_25585/m.60098 type:complete len:285 (+) Transcript_25585:232-1086(+)
MRADEEEMFLFGRARAALGIVAKRPRDVLVLSACGLALAASRLAPIVSGLALTASGGGLVLSVVGHLFTLETRRYDRQKDDLESDKAYRESDFGRARMEMGAILAAHVPPPIADQVNEYVPRRELEAKLEAYLQQPKSKAGAYLVAYGARGAGKSTLVEHARAQQERHGYRRREDGRCAGPRSRHARRGHGAQAAPRGSASGVRPLRGGQRATLRAARAGDAGLPRGPPGQAGLASDGRDRRRQVGRQQAHRERVRARQAAHARQGALPRHRRAEQLVCGGLAA